MKLCQIMLAKGFGGAERYFVDLSQQLADRGHQVLAICHHGGQAASLLRPQSGLEVKTVKVLGAWDLFAARRIRQQIQKFGAELIHAHLARAAHLAGHAIAGTTVPLLAKTHNYVNVKYYRQVSQFLPTTKDQHDYLLEQGITADKIQVIPNFSALPAIAEPQKREKISKLVSCGRFVEKKGFENLLSVFVELAKNNSALQLTLVGDGERRPQIQTVVDKAGLHEQVHLPGWQEEVGPYLDAADAFVLPSLDEPFGIVVLEAMARGLPIVSTMTQGPVEILNEQTAWLVPVGDNSALKQALSELIDEPELAETKARAALKKYIENYSAEAVIPRLLSVYQSQIKAVL